MSRWAEALPLYSSCATAVAVVPTFSTKPTVVYWVIPVGVKWNNVPFHAHLARYELAGTHEEDDVNKWLFQMNRQSRTSYRELLRPVYTWPLGNTGVECMKESTANGIES